MSTGTFQAVKRPGRGVGHPPNPTKRLKKEYSYTYTPLWALMTCSKVNVSLSLPISVLYPGTVNLQSNIPQLAVSLGFY